MKRFLLKLATIVIGVVVALLLAEIVLRLYFSLSHPRPIIYTKNSRGFRDREHALVKGAGVLRIAFQGDSYTYGAGVEAGDRFSERSGALLAARLPGRKIEVLNFGRSGQNIASDLASMKKDVLPYDPDVIVFGFVLNDFDFPQMEINLFDKSQRETVNHKWFGGLERYSKLALFFDRVAINLFSDANQIHIRFLDNIWNPEINPFYERMRRHLYELVEIISQRKGIVVFFPYFISANEKDLTFYQRAKHVVSEACQIHDCRFLEVLPLLSHKSFRHWWAAPDDHHPNAEAHAIVARAIADIIAKTL
jgi:lysophospholipase L1-like esterase